MKVIYCGYFLDADELYAKFPPKLARKIDCPHVTTKFRPGGTDLHEGWLGQTCTLTAVGYGRNNKNEGLLVAPLEKFQLEKPHITLSVSEDGKPVDTVALDFAEIEPVDLTAHFGWYCADGSVYFGGKAKRW